MYKVVERCFWIDETKDAETIKEFKEKDKSRASIPLSEKGIGDPKEEDIMTNVVNYKVGQYLGRSGFKGVQSYISCFKRGVLQART